MRFLLVNYLSNERSKPLVFLHFGENTRINGFFVDEREAKNRMKKIVAPIVFMNNLQGTYAGTKDTNPRENSLMCDFLQAK